MGEKQRKQEPHQLSNQLNEQPQQYQQQQQQLQQLQEKHLEKQQEHRQKQEQRQDSKSSPQKQDEKDQRQVPLMQRDMLNAPRQLPRLRKLPKKDGYRVLPQQLRTAYGPSTPHPQATSPSHERKSHSLSRRRR